MPKSLVSLCVQRTLCPRFQVWNSTSCGCVASKKCKVEKCERGWKFDTTHCKCFKKTPVVQRYLCPAGTAFCEHCGKCITTRGCTFFQPKCKKGIEVFDKTVCECINVRHGCIQRYLCEEDYRFDFEKCICVKNKWNVNYNTRFCLIKLSQDDNFWCY